VFSLKEVLSLWIAKNALVKRYNLEALNFTPHLFIKEIMDYLFQSELYTNKPKSSELLAGLRTQQFENLEDLKKFLTSL